MRENPAFFWRVFRRLIVLLAVVPILTPCGAGARSESAPSQKMADALRLLVANDLRVGTIGWRLQTGGLKICARKENLSGLIVEDATQYAANLQPMVAQVLGLRGLPTIVAVVPGSAAERAGILPGDEIDRINGLDPFANLPQGAPSEHDDTRHDLVLNQLRNGLHSGPVELELRRDGRPQSVILTGTPGCASEFQIDLANKINSAADGETVTVWRGLLNFVDNDDELAFMMGHELAHNILGHHDILTASSEERRARLGKGSLLEQTRLTERQADYLGLYLVAWAGYDVHAAVPFWEKMADNEPLMALSFGRSHPSDRQRIRDLTAEAARIDADRAAGRPLLPGELEK